MAVFFLIAFNLDQLIFVLILGKFSLHFSKHFVFDVGPDIALSFLEVFSAKWLEDDSDTHHVLLGTEGLLIPVPLLVRLLLASVFEEDNYCFAISENFLDAASRKKFQTTVITYLGCGVDSPSSLVNKFGT